MTPTSISPVFIFGGNSKAVFDVCFLQHEVILSEFILNEITNVFTKKFNMHPDKLSRLIDLLVGQAKVIEPKGLKPTICRDPDDDHILWLAKIAKVDFIITGDKDLLILKNFKNTSIMHPKQYLASINLI